ncbi:MAG: hypothetical protein ACREGB_04050, partial [Candidatus Saccharimonadales bacterium]
MGQYVYLAGGRFSGANTSISTIYAALCTGANVTTTFTTNCTTSSTPGTLSSWSTAPSFTTAREFPTLAVQNDELYLAAGGSGGTGLSGFNDIQYIKINPSTGAPIGSSWTTSPQTITTTRDGQGGGAYNGYLYIAGGCNNIGLFGGCNGSAQRDVQYTPLNNGGGGTTGSWITNTTSLNTARTGHGTVVSNGYLYVLGGSNNGVMLTSVEYAPINTNGSIGTFNSTSSINGSSSGPSGNSGYAVYNGYIYKTGGNNGSTSTGNDVQYAAICTGGNTTTAFITNCTTSSTPGTLSSWAYTANGANNGTTQSGGLITARSEHVVAAYNGYLYVAGGCTSLNGAFSSCNGFSSAVDSAPLKADGTVGTWTTVGNFTTGRYGVSGMIYDGYLYITGGCSSNDGFGNCNALLNDVQYAQISNGTLASNAGCGTTWCYGSSFSGSGWWYDNALSANNGYLYLLGVENHNPAAANTQYAPIYSNGMIGQWQSVRASYSTNRMGKATLTYDGNLYVIGGCNNNTAGCNNSQMGDVQYAPLQVQARIAHYSYLVDLKSTSNGTVGGDPQITRFGVGFSPASASSAVNVCWQGATTAAPSNNNVFGGSTCFTNPASKTPQAWKSYGRYAFAYVTLDDTQSATYPD